MDKGDFLIDRKRLKARLSVWRALALLGIFGLGAVLSGGLGKQAPSVSVTSDYIAQINLEGTLFDDPNRDALFEKIENDTRAKALIVRMDSPGGTTIAGEEIYLQLRAIAEKKPVVAVMRTLCTSACYMAALASDHIIAREGSVTGSIGVMMQSAEFSELAKKLGVNPITVKSGPYKDVPALAEPFTPEQRAVVASVVNDAYDHFIRLIVDRRKFEDTAARALADGRVYTGAQAANLKLIDSLGGDKEARQWLNTARKLSPKLEIREMSVKEPLPVLAELLQQVSGIKIWGNHTLGLDGLVSIWHPSLQ